MIDAQAKRGLVAEQPITFAELLRAHRRARGLTVRELARCARLSERTISDLERGRKSAQLSIVRLLAQALALAGDDASAFEAARTPPGQSALVHAPSGARRDRTYPRPLTSFVGRDRELRQLEQLLASSRLLTLTARVAAARLGSRCVWRRR